VLTPPSPEAPLLAVAVSGGLDSTVLLHVLARHARELGLRVLALHVDHALQPVSAQWAQRLRRQCQRWRAAGLPVEVQVFRLSEAPPPGASIEAWARQQRYQALARMAHAAGATQVWLAHHRRDQAETFFLQALRGAGPAGLAAMPQTAEREGLLWLRPWLNQPRSAIEAYAARWRLSWVEDASNADTRFDRNRLRHKMWPALLAAFPAAENALGQAARQAARAAELMREIGQQDAGALSLPGGVLDVAACWRYTPARRYGALKAWLQQQRLVVPESLLERLLLELGSATHGRWPAAPGRVLVLYRQQLRVLHEAAQTRGCAQAASSAHPAFPAQPENCPAAQPLPFPGPGQHVLPAWAGVLEVRAVVQGGIAEHWLACAVLVSRSGGESFQLTPKGMARALKKQYQARGVPAWQRSGPLLRAGPEEDAPLLFAPGLGVDARALALPGQPQWLLVWQPEHSDTVHSISAAR
jgi:tRNA(Ile)-lysidine synthase